MQDILIENQSNLFVSWKVDKMNKKNVFKKHIEAMSDKEFKDSLEKYGLIVKENYIGGKLELTENEDDFSSKNNFCSITSFYESSIEDTAINIETENEAIFKEIKEDVWEAFRLQFKFSNTNLSSYTVYSKIIDEDKNLLGAA